MLKNPDRSGWYYWDNPGSGYVIWYSKPLNLTPKDSSEHPYPHSHA
jgi:hypothetical protein